MRQEEPRFIEMYLSYDDYYGLASICFDKFQDVAKQVIAEKNAEHASSLRPVCISDLEDIQSIVAGYEVNWIALNNSGAQSEVKMLWQMLVVNISQQYQENSFECRNIGIDLDEPLKQLAVKLSLQDEIKNWP